MHKNIKQNNYSRYAANRDVISLFSGAMGLDIGLGKAGLNVAIGQDFDAIIRYDRLICRRAIFDLRRTAVPAFFYSRKKIGYK